MVNEINGLKLMFKFEGISINSVGRDIQSIVRELSKPKNDQSQHYINEKCRNVLRVLEGVSKNFAQRMEIEDCQKDFIETYRKMVEEVGKSGEW